MNQSKELEDQIVYHKALYYQGRPEISDIEYDALEEKLRSIDPHNPVLNMVGSIVDKLDKIEHDTKMLSLNKVYKEEELADWMSDHECISTHKIDGVSCSLIYENGHLHLAKTRGDGQFGENITEKVKWIKNVPKKVSLQGRIEIRGELFCHENSFLILAEEMERLGFDRPTSQRNIVAGLMGRKENIELARYLSFYAFDLLTEKKVYKKELEKFNVLKKENFDIPEVVVHKNDKKIKKTLTEAKDFIVNGEYQIDGLVFSYNDLDLQDQLGSTAHHPRFKMAFKFPGEAKNTTINSLSWQVSRNGIITPIANVEPVDLAGAMISRVTLHNYGMVKAYNLKSGDVISVIRSGEVIPKFLSVVEGSNEDFAIPESCPSCAKLTVVDDIRLLCPNPKCPARVREEILNFIKKIGIEDLSEKRLEEMMKIKLVSSIQDLFRLKKERLLELDKVKDKLADKLLATIDSAKNPDLITFLSSLGLKGGAYNRCEKIVRNGFDTIDKVLGLTVEQLTEVEGFAEKSAEDLLTSLKSKEDLIQDLIGLGVTIKEPGLVSSNESAISGKKICITGSLTRKRSVIEEMIREHGGIVVSSVSKATDYLLTNEENGTSSKFKKATSLDIPIISEENFIKFLQ